MSTVSPEQFARAYVFRVIEMREEIKALWRFEKEFTKLVLEEVLPRVAADIGLCVYNADYYTLDAIFYQERDESNFPGRTYAKSIQVAFEHENLAHGPSGSIIEMNKLQIINAPLKVLVTYASRSLGEQQSLLAKYEDIVRQADQFGDAGVSRKQLVIFGELRGEFPEWSCYCYALGEGFVEIDQPSLVAGS